MKSGKGSIKKTFQRSLLFRLDAELGRDRLHESLVFNGLAF